MLNYPPKKLIISSARLITSRHYNRWELVYNMKIARITQTKFQTTCFNLCSISTINIFTLFLVEIIFPITNYAFSLKFGL